MSYLHLQQCECVCVAHFSPAFHINHSTEHRGKSKGLRLRYEVPRLRECFRSATLSHCRHHHHGPSANDHTLHYLKAKLFPAVKQAIKNIFYHLHLTYISVSIHLCTYLKHPSCLVCFLFRKTNINSMNITISKME